MLLAVNVGNTNVMFALFSGEDLVESWRLHTDSANTADDWWIAVKLLADDAKVPVSELDGVVVSSVVPVVGHNLIQMAERYLDVTPVLVNARLPLHLGLVVKDPDSVGADRICNVVAVRELYSTPGVIVDLGTATTFDVVDEKGHFIGGSIAPGLEISAQQLFSRAALLSAVDLRVPETVIGRDTETNLQAGIVLGTVDLIDGMLRRIQQESGWKQMEVVVTGGLGGLICSELQTPAVYDPDLTVKGLRLVYQQCG